MKIVRGFEEAAQLLSRRVSTAAPSLSPRLKSSLVEMFGTSDPDEAVRLIISHVRGRGDAALREYSALIDKVSLNNLEVSRQQMKQALSRVPAETLAALNVAAEQVRNFHLQQMMALETAAGEMAPGTLMRIIEKAGMYVPGGTASYPSSVLMTVIPAKAAGVSEVIVCTPPGKDGRVPDLTLAAALLAGVDHLFAVGGAQAIAAMAYGTESIPRVDKICGPGNIFVTSAKKQVYGAVAIDGLEGPSEVLILADGSADPAFCAADMLAQAEHDALAQAILITDAEELARAVMAEIDKQITTLERGTLIREALAQGGLIALVASVEQGLELANLYAPEHLCLLVSHPERYLEKIQHAGCVFIGEKTSVVMGDYVAGPSHALPTSGTARFSSPLNVAEFIRYMNVVDVDNAVMSRLGPAAVTLAKAEGLTAHAAAIEIRLE
jgi:histidinol dehydrogenase